MNGVRVDTSVWVEHFRQRNNLLAGLLQSGLVLIHPPMLASTRIIPNTALWTRDKRLNTLAERFDVAYRPTRH